MPGMHSRALYYPEWSISDAQFFAESLLYWDRLAVLVPDENFRPAPFHRDNEIRRLLQQLHEEVVTPIVPTDEQKDHAHERVMLLFEDQVAPEWLRPANLLPTTRATLAVPKFKQDTLNILVRNKWARPGTDIRGIPVHEISVAAANVVMAALANECSSSDMPPITSDPGGFVTACNIVLKEMDAPRGLALGERVDVAVDKPIEADLAFLLEAIPRPGLRDEITAPRLKYLIASHRDPDISRLRTGFKDKLDEYLKQLRTAKSPERQVIRDQFGAEYKLALAGLDRELGRMGLRDVICSKDGILALVVGLAAGTLAPSLGLAIGLSGLLLNVREKRRQLFEKNWVAWAYGIDGKKLTLK